MKRGINFYEALFLFFLLFKLKGWEAGPAGVPSWILVFSPLIIDAVFTFYKSLAVLYGWDRTWAFMLYKRLLKWRLNRVASEARKDFLTGYKNGTPKANPGQFIDPSKFGKQ